MSNYRIVLRTVPSPYSLGNDVTKKSVLSHQELDKNFINLKGKLSEKVFVKNNELVIEKVDGSKIKTDLSGIINQQDTYVTGGTYDNNTGLITFFDNSNNDFTVDLGTIDLNDTYITGGTYDNSTGIITFENNDGNTFDLDISSLDLNDTFTTAATLNNNTLIFDTTDQLSAYTVDLSKFVFTGNTSGDCINDLWVSNIHGCSPITIHDELQHSGSTATGRFNTAFGYNTLASGENSHTEGNNTTASGDGGHAEGDNNTASGTNSHAEGKSTEASSDQAHAEGNFTIASGDHSHAEGESTKATGNFSHAQNRVTEANADYSHAEGNSKTNVGAQASHAEGWDNQTNGPHAHAEGERTKANGENSHSQGLYTEANGNQSHIGGSGTFDVQLKAQGDNSFNHSEVNDSYSGTGVEGHRSVILGGLNQSIEQQSHNSAIFGGTGNTINSGYTNSVIAGGHDNLINSNSSLIEGGLNETKNHYSHAEGYNTVAGYFQEKITEEEDVFSGGTIQSGDINEGTFVISDSSITCPEDGDKFIDNPDSFSLISSDCSIDISINSVECLDGEQLEINFNADEEVPEECIEETYTAITGSIVTVLQKGINNQYAHSEGLNTIATGDTSHVENELNEANASRSHAEGYNNVVDGPTSHAEGEGNYIGNNVLYSHIEGYFNTINSDNTNIHVKGENNTVQSNTSSELYVEGDSNTITSNVGNTHIEGVNNQVSRLYGGHIEGGEHSVDNSNIELTNDHIEGRGHQIDTNATNFHVEGSNNVVEGTGEGINVDSVHTQNKYTEAEGTGTHAGGLGESQSNTLKAKGTASFNHSRIIDEGSSSTADGKGSAILGGGDHVIENNSFDSGIYAGKNNYVNAEVANSAIVGGDNNLVLTSILNSAIIGGQNITADASDTTYVPNFNINYEPSTGETSGNTFLARNDSSGDVEEVTDKDLTQVVKNNSKYAETIPSGSTSTTTTINHNLNDEDVIVQLWKQNDELIGGNIFNKDANSLDVSFDSDPQADVRVVVRA